MRFNAKCSRLPVVAPLIAVLWVSGCATDGSNAGVSCPPVVAYSAAEQARAAAQVATLVEGAVVTRMLSDYAVMRDQERACR